GGAGNTQVNGVAADASSDLVFTGICGNATFSFGGPPQICPGTLYVAQAAPGGVVGSPKFFSTSNAQTGQAIAVAPSGLLVLVGQEMGSLDFGNGPLPVPMNTGAFVAQIAP